MNISARQRKKMSSVPSVTDERCLHIAGASSALVIPKIFCKSLGWVRGSTVIEIKLNQDKTLTLREMPQKKTPKPLPELPLLNQ